MPNPTDEHSLVEMLLRQDDTIIPRLLDYYGYELTKFLARKYSRDLLFVQDVVTDALILLWQNPRKYDPGKSSLKTFLARDIEGDLLNAIEREARQKKSATIVELETNTRNIDSGENPLQQIVSEEIILKIKRFFESIFPSETDQRLAWMMEVEQVRETRHFALELDLNHLEEEHLEREVKRVKDRIKAQLKRKDWAALKEKLKRHD